MVIEEAIQKHLTAYQGLYDLIGKKIYPMVIPEKVAHPAMTYQLISSLWHDTLSSDSNLLSPIFQFNIYAKKISENSAIAKQLKNSFKGFQGLMGGTGGVKVQAVLIQSETDGYEEETKTFYKYLEFKFFYEEEQ